MVHSARIFSRFSAIQTKSFLIISFSAVSQALVTRLGIRRVLSTGLLFSAAALVLFARLPVHGSYFSDLFPAFLLSGLGLALAFVPISIGGLTGVRQADAGIASGLINTTQQIGGAIGVAIVTTIFTSRFKSDFNGHNPLQAATSGYQWAFWALFALALAGAVAAFILLRGIRTGEAIEPEAAEVAV